MRPLRPFVCLFVGLEAQSFGIPGATWDHSVGGEGHVWCQIPQFAPASCRPLAFLHADFGKEFPSRTLWREVHRETAPFQALCCAHRSTATEHFSRAKKSEKMGGRGVTRKGKKGRVETAQAVIQHCATEGRGEGGGIYKFE